MEQNIFLPEYFKIIFFMFIFQHGLNLKLFLLRSKAQVMKLILYVTESINCKKLTPIIDAIITLVRLGLPFRGHRDESKYHPKLGGTQVVGLITL